MKVREKFRKAAFAAVTAGLLLIIAPASMSASSANFAIILPENAQAQTGKTYGEWSARWWQYVLEIPFDNNPIFDATGANCNFGQSGAVFFLASTPGGSAIRDECRVPAGKPLFFPLLGFARFKEVTDPQPEVSLRAVIKGFSKSTSELQANIDGEVISISLNPKTTALRTLSPAGFFTVTAPVNNVFGGIPGQTYDLVSDGFYLLVAPLPPGPHTIKFGGVTRNFAADVTYRLIVEP